jgi:hypothetical protein
MDKIKLYKTIVNIAEEYNSNLLKNNHILIIYIVIQLHCIILFWMSLVYRLVL